VDEASSVSATSNPFATGRLERVLAFDPELVGTSWEAIFGRWESLGRRACVVGHHGAGKTTFLDAFAKRLDAPVVRWFFNDERRRLDAADRARLREVAGKVVLLDGDRHLPWAQRRELRRALEPAAGVLSARHRAGDLPVLIELRADAELAGRLLEKIDPALAAELERELPRLLQEHRGNLRELWLACYDLWSARGLPPLSGDG
jgi:hypothetical protein